MTRRRPRIPLDSESPLSGASPSYLKDAYQASKSITLILAEAGFGIAEPFRYLTRDLLYINGALEVLLRQLLNLEGAREE